MNKHFARLVVLAALSMAAISANAQTARTYDVVIYGGTAAAISAAVQVVRMGKTVAVVSPDKHLGGMSSGGLGFTDTGNKAVIGGIAREFYHRIWLYYSQPSAWVWEKREQFGNKGQGTPAIDGEMRTMWLFEPHVAEKVFEDLVREYRIPVLRDEWLERGTGGVTKEGSRILEIKTLSGKRFGGRMFIDATYEGDLMAAAKVSYHTGREANSVYNEKWNGVQVGVLHHGHHFGAVKEKISPYVIAGNPSSGVLPRISTLPPGEYGQGDKRVQAYCYRTCLTDHPDNRVSFPKPDGYDAKQYELLLRVLNAGWREAFQKFDLIPNRKTDTNNHGPFSFDNIGYSYDYPEATYDKRREILREHTTYQQNLLYFLANDPRVPGDVRELMQRWGLSKDEFKDNGNWPHQIYVREARRLVGSYVMTEHDILKETTTPESVGMGSYTIDSHNVQRYITADGHVQNEGDIGVPTNGPYQIAYGALIPKKGEVTNLLVPVCVSASHIAFGSIRMEPVFMILGQSAATAAVLAIDGKADVQDVPYEKLRARLLEDKQILEFTQPAQVRADKRPEDAIVTFYKSIYGADKAAFDRVTRADPRRAKFFEGGRKDDEKLSDVRSNPEAIQMRKMRPFLLKGKVVEADKDGDAPVGSTALYMTAHGSGPTVISLTREQDGWKVDLRWLLEMIAMASREGQKMDTTTPDFAARALTASLIALDRKGAARFAMPGANMELLFAGAPRYREPSGHLDALALEMPIIEIGPGEFFPMPSGRIVEGIKRDGIRVLVGMFGPTEIPFVLHRIGTEWKVEPEPYLPLINR